MKKTFYFICVLLIIVMGFVLWQSLKLIAYGVGLLLTGIIIGWFLHWLHRRKK